MASTKLPIVVSILPSGSPLLDEVKALWRTHSRTLGFFPDGALIDYADRGQIISAVIRYWD